MSHAGGSVASNEAEGLLSLSLAAASAVPIPVAWDSGHEIASGSYNGPSSFSGGGSSVGASSKIHLAHRNRRVASTGHVRRKLSDAREAASRPSPVTISSAAAALTSLAKLSLSGTPPPQTSTTLVSASGTVSSGKQVKEEDVEPANADLSGTGISIENGKGTGKRRGTIFKCESCSKVYKHPSCLIKHRWEHSPHWREASKFLLSKHQQVQLLEAAAILSHLSPSAQGGTSLPEDRSLWPSFLSGGLLPPPDPANTVNAKGTASTIPLAQPAPFRASSSVPALSVLSSSARSGPRMHDYAVPATGGITQLRPGVLGVPTGSSTPAPAPAPTSTAPVPIVPVPVPALRREESASVVSDAWSSPVSVSFAPSSLRSSSVSASALGRSYSDGTGGWSLPRSSVRSESGSRSRSGSVEDDFVDVDGVDDYYGYKAGGGYGFSVRSGSYASDKGMAVDVGHEKIEEEWDGEMEMEM
ncbi:hypothetical protein WOLCODRAFT_141029 [Wolfiporia cocos MD-104 SS10]|uniref:C2H2-type domain-containing protein n=1 Tax=Wolfiporia cocos (strain MD-104) TaxID=742152 RepID=A0A2H3JBK2_WOLCO|nr:hypothetical protein WOLCODRAFT_141029 [Wolfiporia cocos MD-104 SS10]